MVLKVILLFLISLTIFSNERIVSTVPSISEILYELKLSESVVGVSRYCLFNEKFCEKEKVGTSLDFSYEKILKLNPTIVLLSSSASSSQISNLSKLQLKTLVLEHDRLSDIYNAIEKLGSYFSKNEDALLLKKKLDNSINRKITKSKNEKVLFLISSVVKNDRIVKVQAAGGENFYSDILKKMGLENALSGYKIRYPEIGRERLLSLKYDYIVEIFGHHNKDTLITKKNAWIDYKRSRKSSFRYIPLSGDYLFIPGPRVWMIARDLKEMLEDK